MSDNGASVKCPLCGSPSRTFPVPAARGGDMSDLCIVVGYACDEPHDDRGGYRWVPDFTEARDATIAEVHALWGPRNV